MAPFVYKCLAAGQPARSPTLFFSSAPGQLYKKSFLCTKLVSIIVVALSGQVERTFVTYGMYE